MTSPALGVSRRIAGGLLPLVAAPLILAIAGSCGSESGSGGRGADILESEDAATVPQGEARNRPGPAAAVPEVSLTTPAAGPESDGIPVPVYRPAPEVGPGEPGSGVTLPGPLPVATVPERELATVAPRSAEPQEILLDLRFARLAGSTVRAYALGDVPLLPAFAFMEMAEIDVRADSTGALRATLHPGARPLYIGADSALARVDGRSVIVRPGQLFREGEELFVAAPVLEALLDLTIRTDWISLTTTVLDPGELPLARRLAREERWDRIRAGRSAAASIPTRELNNRRLGGAVLDWGVSNNVRAPGESLAYSMALGARVMEGSLRVSARSLGPISVGDDRFDATYERVFRGLPWLTQMRLGDGFTTGPRLRNVRGVALTNAPYLRGADFASDVFQGRVGPGWDVELRQSGQVLDLTRADEQGAFALDIPLRYGENAIQVVAFGPHGEVITTDRLLLAGTELIPDGAFEWGLSGGACRDERCDATGNLDLRYGVSGRLTIRGGTEAFTTTDGDAVVQPYLQASGLVLPSLQLSAEALRAGFIRGSSNFAPSPWLRLRGAYTAFSSELDEPLLHDRRRRSTTEADVFFRPRPSQPRLFLRASLLDQELSDGSRTRLQASATVPVGRLALEGGIRREVDDPVGPVRTAGDFQFGALFGHVRLFDRHRVWLRGEVEVREARVMNRVRALVGYQVSNQLRLNVAAGWQKYFGANVSITFNAFLSGLRSLVQVNGAEGAESQMTQFTQGTVYWNEATRQVNFAPGPGIQRGGLSGYVFLDENGNGVRDTGETGLEGVRLVVGGRPSVSDEEGRHTSWDLVPYQRVDVWADSTSIADPTLVPATGTVRVDVPPSSFGRIDVPVTPSRQIAGSVLQVPEDGGPGLAVPYAQLELVNAETGDVRAFRTFSDGQFYEAGVRPGRYELRLARDYMEQSGLLPEGSWPTVLVTPENPFEIVGPVELRLVRTRSGGGGTP